MSITETFTELRWEIIKLEMMTYVVFFVGGIFSIATYTTLKTLIPYMFWKRDPDFIKALHYEKKKDSMDAYAVFGVILLSVIAFFLLLSFWIFIFTRYGGRTFEI